MKNLLELLIFFILVALGQKAFIDAMWRERSLTQPEKPARLRAAVPKIKPRRLRALARAVLGRGRAVLGEMLGRLYHRPVW